MDACPDFPGAIRPVSDNPNLSDRMLTKSGNRQADEAHDFCRSLQSIEDAHLGFRLNLVRLSEVRLSLDITHKLNLLWLSIDRA